MIAADLMIERTELTIFVYYLFLIYMIIIFKCTSLAPNRPS